jgi:hypothetical protein
MIRKIIARREQAEIRRIEELESKYIALAARNASIQSYNSMVRARNPELYSFENWMPESK